MANSKNSTNFAPMKEKYLWLVSLFKKYNRLAFEDIATYWLSAPCNKDQKPLSDRTFRNWRKQIEEQFGARIECHSQKYYTMTATVKTGMSERVSNRLMEMYALNEIATSNPELECRILLEETPNCVEYLQLIAQAMKESRIMKMSYGNMTSNEYIAPFRCAPVCIREYQRRYYVVMKWVDVAPNPKAPGMFAQYGKFRVYAVDKITTLEILDANFKYPKDFSIEVYSLWHYGGYDIDKDECPKIIRIMVKNELCELLDKFPLHPSQQKYMVDGDYSYYQFDFIPSDEFCADFVRACYGRCQTYNPDCIRILEPEEVRECMWDLGDSVRFDCLTEYARKREMAKDIELY